MSYTLIIFHMHLYALLDKHGTEHMRALTYLAQGQHKCCQVLASTAYPPDLSADDATRKVAIHGNISIPKYCQESQRKVQLAHPIGKV